MIDAKQIETMAENVANHIVKVIKSMGLEPSEKAVEEGRLPDEDILQIYDTMPQEIKDFLRGHWGDEVWAEYEAAIEEMRGGE